MAFIDEVFKANSAILNTLLTILNERLFDNGAERVRVPLICLVRCGPRLSVLCHLCGGSTKTAAFFHSFKQRHALLGALPQHDPARCPADVYS